MEATNSILESTPQAEVEADLRHQFKSIQRELTLYTADLSDQEVKFCDLMASSPYAHRGKCYLQAGFAAKSLRGASNAARFKLLSPRINRYYQRLLEARMARLRASGDSVYYTPEEVIRWLQDIRKRAMEPVPVIDSKGDAIPGAYMYDAQVALKAIDRLGGYLGMSGFIPGGQGRSDGLSSIDARPEAERLGIPMGGLEEHRRLALEGPVVAVQQKSGDTEIPPGG